MKNIIVPVVLSLITVTYCSKEIQGQSKTIAEQGEAKPMNSVAEKIKAGALVVDVRSPMEYQMGHYSGAINIPVDQIPARIKEFGDKNREIIVYCASGARSGSAKHFLEQHGYKVTNAGGLRDMPR